MGNLGGHRLIYVAPLSGSGGVGDYSDDFVAAVRPHFASVQEYRHPGPGGDGVLDLLRHRRALRKLVAEEPDVPTIVHCEQSGGSMVPFWAALGLESTPGKGGVSVSATVHDPPYAVWWPFRTKLVARSRVLAHGIHLPLHRLTRYLEAWGNKSRRLFTLSRLGAEKLGEVMTTARIVPSAHFVPERPALDSVTDRPLAIGLFGYVYRGKGFDMLAELREVLDDDITIRVAGRGTEVLEPMPGVEILGEVNGPDEDAFFNSIRVLLVPYGGRKSYGREAFPATGTVSRAIAYQTPVLARAYGSLRELEGDGGAVVVEGEAAELAAAANTLLRDGAALARLQAETAVLRDSRSMAKIAEEFVAVWSSDAGTAVPPATAEVAAGAAAGAGEAR
jgi:polysaccharide biosynthesis protein PslF